MNFYQGCAGKISPFAIEDFDYRNCVIEEKFDGIWCEVRYDSKSKVRLISRNGKSKDNEQLQSLIEYLENFELRDTSLIGELMFSSQRGTEYAKRYGHHKIFLFDVVKYRGHLVAGSENILNRKQLLSDLIKDADKTWVENGWWLHGKNVKAEKIKKLYEKVVAEGGEGLIVKDIEDNEYRYGGKSPYWYKIKKHVTMDYVIMGFSNTNSADFMAKGWIGGIVGGLFVNKELVKKVIVGSMTFEWREELSKNSHKYIGKVMEVGGFEIFKSGSIRHPYFLGIRNDKPAKDCTWNS